MAANEDDIFEASGNNDVKRLREILDLGIDINATDFDKGWTPLHVAASRGAKQTIEILVARGCDLSPQDNRGSTPLHSLIYKRFDVLAMWLVKQGADLHLPDDAGFSPFFYNALDWFQKELEGAANSRDEDEVGPVVPKSLPSEETLKIYFKNGSFKSVRLSRDETAKDLIEKIREKVGMTSHIYDKHLEVSQVVRTQQRRVQEAANLFILKSKWALHTSSVVSGNTTIDEKQCHFMVAPKKTAPPEVHAKYETSTIPGF